MLRQNPILVPFKRSLVHSVSRLFVVFAIFMVLAPVYTYTRERLSPRPVYAATGINRQISFQGKLVNPDGTNVTNGTYSIVFSVYTVASAGTNIWTETQSPTVTNGIFQVNLGSVAPLPGSIDFNTDNIYLGIKVGSDAEMTPRVQFTSVPQAFNAEKLGGLDKTGFIQNQSGSAQSTSSFWISGTARTDTGLTTPVLQSAGSAALTVTGNASSTWSTTAGTLTLQGFGGTTLTTPATATASTNSSAVTISTGNATGSTSNSGSLTLDVGTATQTTGTISIGANNASAVTISRAGILTSVLGDFAVGASAGSGTLFTNNGATLNATLVVGNATVDGAIGALAASASVDRYTSFLVTQTTSGRILTLPNPTTATAGRIAYVSSASASTQSFTMYGVTLSAGTSQTYIWNGSIWAAASTKDDTLATVTARGATTAVASSFTGGATIRGLIVDNATATQDRILVTAAAVGAARFDGTITNIDLTAARTYTLPDASGTFAVSASGNVSLSAAGNIALTGQVPIANGGTGASTAQGAINAVSGLTTEGDLLYRNATNSTRLGKGSNGQCLTSSSTTIVWGSCGLASEVDTLATVTARGATTAVASSFTGGATIRNLSVDSSTPANDLIAVNITTTGAASFTGTITNADLTSAQTYTLPNATGTFITTGNLTSITATGIIASGTWQGGSIADAYLQDNITVSSSGTVDWTALNSYPAACAAGSAVSQIADTLTCTAFVTSLTDTLATVTARGATTAVASSFTGGATIRGLIVDNATATQDRILVTAAAVGAARFDGTITNIDLTAARTYTLPDASGTFAVSASGNVSLSAAGNIALTGQVPIANGGTGASTAQGAINAVSGLTTEGDLLYRNATNSTRLGKGSNGQCLTSSSTTIVWGSCGLASEVDTLATVTARGATTAVASSFTGGATIRNLSVDSSTPANDLIAVNITTTGAASFTGTITNADLTSAQTYTLPNATGTFITTGNLTSITATGIIASGTWQGGSIADAYLQDNITVSSSGTVDWTALNSYPAACAAGSAVSQIADTLTCTAFVTSLTDTLATVTARGATTAVASSFTGGATIRGLIVDNATATQDRILVTAAAVGAARFDGTITNIDLTAARTYTLPDASGTFAVSASGNVSLSAAGNIALTGQVPIANGGTGASTAQGAINAVSGLTTEGDLLYRNATNSTRLGKGSNGQCLTSSSTTIVWGSCGLASEVDTLATVTARGATTAVASSFTGGATIRNLSVDSSTPANDLIAVNITTTGAASFTGTITNADLTSAQTYTLPNATGTFITTGNLTSITATGIIASGTWQGGSIADAYLQDNITVSSSGTVDWTALNSYPAACAAGSAVSQIADTLTCTAFVTSLTDTLATVTARGATTAVASSFTGGATIRGLIVDNATATQDRILVTAAAVGAARFDGTITNIDLTAAQIGRAHV